MYSHAYLHVYRTGMSHAKKLINNSLMLLYFSRFIMTTVPAQAALMLLFIKKPILPLRIYLYVFAIVFYWATVFGIGYARFQLQNLIFFFSFLPPLLVFFSMRQEAVPVFITDKFIKIVAILTLIEAILVNSPYSGLLFFYPKDDVNDYVQLLGFYQRPLGIGGNPSMTSCVLIFSLVMSDLMNKIFTLDSKTRKICGIKQVRDGENAFFSYRTILVAITILILASGTGFALLFLYYCTRWFSHFRLNMTGLVRLSGITIVIAIMIFGCFYVTEHIDNFDKFSLTYFQLMYDYKFIIIMNSLADIGNSILTLLFGMQVDPSILSASTSGDFGYLSMFNTLGAVGSILVLIAPLLFPTSLWVFRVPTVFFCFSFIHYPGLLSPPGAVLFSIYIYSMFLYKQVKVSALQSRSGIGVHPPHICADAIGVGGLVK